MAGSRIVQRDFRHYRRDRFVDTQTSTSARLSPTLLLTNEMGVSAEIGDELGADDRARVEFDVPSAEVKSAEVIFYVKGQDESQIDSPCLFVNGYRITHHQRKERITGFAGRSSGWDRMRITARYLKKGANEIIFTGGRLYIDPGVGSRSSRSFDGGKTWHVNALGGRGDQAGEYMVRLRLKGFALRGEIVSPVFDLADPEGTGIAPGRPGTKHGLLRLPPWGRTWPERRKSPRTPLHFAATGACHTAPCRLVRLRCIRWLKMLPDWAWPTEGRRPGSR